MIRIAILRPILSQLTYSTIGYRTVFLKLHTQPFLVSEDGNMHVPYYSGLESRASVPVPAKKDRPNSLSQKRSFLSLFVFIIV